MSSPDQPVDFRALFESTQELFLAVHVGEDYRIAAASDAYLRATMIRREETVGRPLFDVFPANPDDPATTSRQQLHEALDRGRAGGPAETLPVFKYDIRRPETVGGGFEAHYWQTSAAPVRDADGKLSLILCRTEEVTARVQADEEMTDARARLEATLGSADVGTWIWEVSTDRVTADRNVARLFGVSAEDAGGGPLEHYTRHIHEDDRERVAANIAAAAAGGRRFDMEYRLRQPDGSIRWVTARGWAEHDTNGAPSRFPGVVIDITERKNAEQALRESEDRLRLAVTAADLGTWDYDLNTLELTWSDACRAMFGVSPDKPITYEDTFLAALHPEDRERAANAVAEATRAGSTNRFDLEYRSVGLEDGVERWIAATGRAYADAEGQPARFIGTVIDITPRKRAEEAIIRHSRQLQKLTGISTRLNTAHDVTSVLGIITEEARNLIGAQRAVTAVAPGLVAPHPVTVVSQQGGAPGTGTTYRGIVGSAQALDDLIERLHGPMRVSREEAENTLALRDPTAAVISPAEPTGGWLAAPLNGRHTRSIGVIHLADKRTEDFTAEDEALLAQLAQIAAVAIENARLYQELRDKDLRKDEFLAMLAHELRNPLAAIRNAVALGSDQEAGAEEIEWSMEVINRQMRQLSRLIDDLLDVSRITQGKVQLRREPLDAARVLQSALDAVQALMEEREHELTVSFRPGTLHLEADPTRLEQIIVNLLSNAAKYTPKGGEISLRAKVEDGHVVIRIRDNGVGIPPDKLQQMFELFAQGDRALARSEGGLGIGLTVVRSLAELHGGTVTATSEGRGRGSEFVLRLPALAPENSPARLASRAAAASRAVRLPVRPAADAAGAALHRILIVDDNADSADGMAKILSLQGHDVRIVYDGPSALDAAREHLPRFVLLDIGLPGMDGYEVATRLRQEETVKDATLIAVSGYGHDTDRRRSREAGFDQHLTKPVDPEQLLALLV